MRKLMKVLGVLAGLALTPTALGAETLADAMVAAYKTSNLLDQNQAVLRATDEDVAAAVASLRPVLEFTTRATWNRRESTRVFESSTLAFDLSASMVIWSGGRGKLAVEGARQQVLGARASLVNIEQQVLLDAVTAYVDVRLQQEVVALRQSNLRVITKELRAARDRFEVGEVTQTDVSLAEAALAESRASLAAAEGQLMVARERYKASTGSYPGRLAALPATPAIPRTLDEAKSVARRSHPAVVQSQHVVKAAELNVRIAKAAFGPTLRGQMTLDKDGTATISNLTAGIELSQTLYAGGRNASGYRKALAQKDSAQSGLLHTTVQVEESVGRVWAQMAVAAASIDAGRQRVAAAQRAFDGVREEATLGARTTLDVLNAEQDLLSARAARLEAEANRYVGVYNVLASMGLLTVDHLKLGVPSFDPEAYYNAVKNAPATSAQGKALDRILKTIGD